MNERLFKLGFDGWWMDASEPEWGYDFSKAHTAMGTGNRYLNAYPFMSKKGVYEGQLSAGSDKRPVHFDPLFLCRPTALRGDNLERRCQSGLGYLPERNSCRIKLLYHWVARTGRSTSADFVPYKFADSPEYPELLVRWYQERERSFPSCACTAAGKPNSGITTATPLRSSQNTRTFVIA